MSFRRTALALLSIISTVLLVLVLAEVALRFLPVATGLRFQTVDESQPIAHLAASRDFVFSKGWDFELVEHGRVNNAGFVNDQDYDAGAETPLLAVIGDSYIEASMVSHEATIQGRLEQAFSGKRRVYSFGVYGAPLSQYLAWAGHARDVYRPDALLINIVGNDFDESLRSYGVKDGFHQFVPDDGGNLVLARNDYAPGGIRSWLRHSALVRYLAMTLDAPQAIANLRLQLSGAAASPSFGFTRADAGPERLADSKKAIDRFLDLLEEASGLRAERILLVMNGLLEPLYDPDLREAAEKSYFSQMRRYFMEAAAGRGYQVLDLDPHFSAHHEGHGQSFRYRLDGHWNGRAHGVAAEAVLDHGFLELPTRSARFER